MTSNVGQPKSPGNRSTSDPGSIEEILATTFKPEFLNRVDDIVIFHRLSRADLGRIVEFQVEQLAGRVRDKGLQIELTDDARSLLGNLGYDPTYGARPLKRVIQKQLIDRLALKLLEGEFREGDTVRVDAGGGELVFENAAPAKTGRRPPGLSAGFARTATWPPGAHRADDGGAFVVGSGAGPVVRTRLRPPRSPPPSRRLDVAASPTRPGRRRRPPPARSATANCRGNGSASGVRAAIDLPGVFKAGARSRACGTGGSRPPSAAPRSRRRPGVPRRLHGTWATTAA